MNNTTKDHFASQGCYMEERFEQGYRCDMRDPSNVEIPKTLKFGHLGVPSLLAQIFEIKPPAQNPPKVS